MNNWYEISLVIFYMSMILIFMVLLYDLLEEKVCIKKPGNVSLKLLNGECGMLQFCLCLPEKSCHDVVSRELTVRVGNGEQNVLNLGAETLEATGFQGMHGEVVEGMLVDVDAAGNRSEPSEFYFVLVDTFPPPAPGQVGLKVTGQVHPEDEADEVVDEADETDTDSTN